MLFYVAGCGRNKNIDIELLASGDYLIRTRGSSFGEPVEAAKQRATNEAAIFCRRDGRIAQIKTIQMVSQQYSSEMMAEAEFSCAPMKTRN